MNNDRVETETAKTVSLKAFLGNAGETWVPRAANTSGVIPIRSDERLGRVIGAASCLENSDGSVVVNISIDRNSPIAFELETGTRVYFLHVAFDAYGAISVGVISTNDIPSVREGERTATGIVYFVKTDD